MNKKKRIIILDSKLEDSDQLQKICWSWKDKKVTEGEAFDQNYVYKCLTKGDLPPIPSANKNNYRFKSIYLADNHTLIGFYNLYYGYPSKNVAWIGMFMIDEKYRGNNYAKEAIKIINDVCKEKGFEKIGIGVHLKNWSGLRFWTKVGFNHTTGIFGDASYQENNFAIIGLEKYVT
jgi:GNAT superfamily N-acetyltransferase